MRNPFKKRKSEAELEIEKLDEQRRLQEAKLRASEIDDEVIKAMRINKLFSTLTEGARDLEEAELRIKHYAETAGINAQHLKETFRFKDSVARLDALDEDAIEKLEKLAELSKNAKKVLGYK